MLLADSKVLRNLREALAVVGRQREAVLLGPAPCDIAGRATQRLDQSWPQDGGAAPVLDAAEQGLPPCEATSLSGEAALVPEPPGLESHEEHWHPRIRPIANDPTRHRHRAIDLAIVLQLLEE